MVYYEDHPIWAMNYYGRILDSKKISAAEAGEIIKASLAAMYQEGRFLGGFEFISECETYVDNNQGDLRSFSGKEFILSEQEVVYELLYHGGMIKDA